MNFFRFPGIISLGILVLVLLSTPSGVIALESFSGDQVSIDTPVADDVFAAGGTITVNAPIDSLIAAGGTITLNAPVKGDVIVAGGRVIANNNIGGKLVAVAKISSRSRGSWSAALATPAGIETIPQYSEFNGPSPKPCPKNILTGEGQGGVKPPTVFLFPSYFL